MKLDDLANLLAECPNSIPMRGETLCRVELGDRRLSVAEYAKWTWIFTELGDLPLVAPVEVPMATAEEMTFRARQAIKKRAPAEPCPPAAASAVEGGPAATEAASLRERVLAYLTAQPELAHAPSDALRAMGLDPAGKASIFAKLAKMGLIRRTPDGAYQALAGTVRTALAPIAAPVPVSRPQAAHPEPAASAPLPAGPSLKLSTGRDKAVTFAKEILLNRHLSDGDVARLVEGLKADAVALFASSLPTL
jgi:hypothetical protein